MRVFLLLAAFLHQPWLRAQTGRTPAAVFYPSLHAYSTQFKDAFSDRANAASLAGIKTFSAGAFSERRFMLRELGSHSLAAAVPTPSGVFGAGVDYSGNALYNETTVGLAYGRSAGSKVDVGLRFNYTTLQAQGYGSASVLGFDAGAVFHLTDAVQAGIAAQNPVGMRFGKEGEERLPAVYSAGIGYDASPHLFLGLEAQKTADRPLTVNAGLHYLFAETLLARGGFSSGTSTYYIGFGFKRKTLRLDVTASFHPYLGLTPGLLLLYSALPK